MAANRIHMLKMRRVRSAVTLLELVLALALTVLVMLSITMAIDVYWRSFDVRRTNVEEAQLARALLRHMADDLRSAMQAAPADLTGLSAVANNSAAATNLAALGLGDDESGTGSSGGGGGSSDNDSAGGSNGSTGGDSGASGSGGSNGGAGGGGGSSDGGSSDPSAVGTASLDGSETTDPTATAAATVGLYGSANRLQIDVSRLPRVDQYEALMNSNGMIDAVDIPSDIKTVSYFLRSEESAAAAETPLALGVPTEASLDIRGRGLMRSEIDRAISSWAATSGDSQATTATAKLLAEEVVGLTFQYFDGYQWLADWDSAQYGGLPKAVEITMVLADAQEEDQQTLDTANFASQTEQLGERIYRLVVHLPTAKLPPATTTAEETLTDPAAADPSAMQGIAP